MDTVPHNLGTLFDQLGMSSDPDSIERFIEKHRLPDDVKVSEAPFWNRNQADFIRRAWEEDADWAETIDELNVRLHENH